MERTALVTGSAGGIGSRVAEGLNRQGYRLILIDKDTERNEQLALQYSQAKCVTLDLMDRNALRRFCHEIENTRLDIAFINAGVVFPCDVLDTSEEQIDLQLDINLRSAILLNQACAKSMIKVKQGHIISTVSMGGIIPMRGTSVYSASKFAMRGFLSALYSEMKFNNVAVSGIYPGAVDTEMLKQEVLDNGSPLNFISKVGSVDDVLSAFNYALKTKKLEVYVSRSDGIFSRILALFPSLLDRLYPSFERVGRKGLARYKAKL